MGFTILNLFEIVLFLNLNIETTNLFKLFIDFKSIVINVNL